MFSKSNTLEIYIDVAKQKLFSYKNIRKLTDFLKNWSTGTRVFELD